MNLYDVLNNGKKFAGVVKSTIGKVGDAIADSIVNEVTRDLETKAKEAEATLNQLEEKSKVAKAKAKAEAEIYAENNKDFLILDAFLTKIDSQVKKIYSSFNIIRVKYFFSKDELFEKEITKLLKYVYELESISVEAASFLDYYEKTYIIEMEEKSIKFNATNEEEIKKSVNDYFNIMEYHYISLKLALDMAYSCVQTTNSYLESVNNMRTANIPFTEQKVETTQVMQLTIDKK